MNSTWKLALAGLGLMLLLWIAYKVGQVLTRILMGLVALGLISWGIWHSLK